MLLGLLKVLTQLAQLQHLRSIGLLETPEDQWQIEGAVDHVRHSQGFAGVEL